MYIQRDITGVLRNSRFQIQILVGPRQCGKSTLFAFLGEDWREITFDDLQYRLAANQDPGLFLSQFPPPVLFDEVQYVPNLFPEIKRQVDLLKKKALFEGGDYPILFRLTGSNQILMSQNVQESLAGRASYFQLNTLSVHEILRAVPDMPIRTIAFQGGWPELYIRKDLSPVAYLNDYIRTCLEKDIMRSAGIQKTTAFYLILQLLASRTGQEVKYTELSNNSGVSAVTVKEWLGLLVQADLIYLLQPYFTNATSRLIKTPKLYFLDTGLAVRLQGWSDAEPLLASPHMGGIFETLVCVEIVKFIRNYQKDWQLFFWRTKEGQEVDFLIRTLQGVYVLEAKLSLQGFPNKVICPKMLQKQLEPRMPLVVVTYGGHRLQISQDCICVPIGDLHDYLETLPD